jgi:hypothetical protein
MRRINVSFYDEVLEDLEERTKEKKSGSLAQSIRELVDLGRKIEKTAAEHHQNDELSDQNIIAESLKNIMRWVLESLLISRQLMMNQSENNQDENEVLLKKCKEQAMSHVKKLFPETGEIIN